MTIREAANNTTTGGISAAASSGGSSGLTEAEVTALANTAILDNNEWVFKRSYYFEELDAQAGFGEDNIDVDNYPRLKMKIFNAHLNSSGHSYNIRPTLDGTQITSALNYTGHGYNNSTPYSFNSSSVNITGGWGDCVAYSSIISQSLWIFEFVFTRSTETNQTINVNWDCNCPTTGGYQSWTHSGNMLIQTSSTNYNGIRFVPDSGGSQKWGKSNSNTDDCRVEVYQGKFQTPTALT